MSDTPRTDAEFKLEAFFDGTGIVETVLVEFAQELESELADKEKQLAEARAEIERLKCCGNCEYCNQRIEVCEHPDNEPEDVMKGRCENWQHDAEAAERGE